MEDIKLQKTIQILRDSYAKIDHDRRRTLKIPIIKNEINPRKPEKKKEITVNVICKAVKMNGEKCKCKAKINGLCGKHLKHNKLYKE